MRRIYLDYNSTTPVRSEVGEAMWPYLSTVCGNPSSSHSFGRESRRAVEEARWKVAAALGSDPEEIVFTSGGTESNNLAIQGAALARSSGRKRIITTGVEHVAVLSPVLDLQNDGFEVVVLPVDRMGRVLPEELGRNLTDTAALVSVMVANNETGVIQDISTLSQMSHESGAIFHTDAVQAFGKVPLDVGELDIDLLSISGHKIYGPKGVGVLYLRRGTDISPVIRGGEQEWGFRSGTENTAGIVGMGVAAELAVEGLSREGSRLRVLRDLLKERILAAVSGAFVSGDCEGCLPQTLNVCFPGVPGSDLVVALDMKGVAVSAGSACHEASNLPSHVLLAMGLDPETARSSIRFSMGLFTSEDEVMEVVDRVRNVLGG